MIVFFLNQMKEMYFNMKLKKDAESELYWGLRYVYPLLVLSGLLTLGVIGVFTIIILCGLRYLNLI